VSSEKRGSASDWVASRGAEHLTSCFEPSEGVLALLSELTLLKEPLLGLFDGGLNLGIAMDAKVAMRDEIWNNDSAGYGGSLVGDLWSRDGNRFAFGDLNGDLFFSLRARTGGCSKSMEDSRDTALESPGHRSDPERPGRGGFLVRHLRRNGEEPRYGENGLPEAGGGP
jgi:hypothetical protein